MLNSGGILRGEQTGFSERLNVNYESNKGVWLEKLEEQDLGFTGMGTFMKAAGFGMAER